MVMNGFGIQQYPEGDEKYVRQMAENFDMLADSGLKPYKPTHSFTSPHEKTGKIFGNFGEIVFEARRKYRSIYSQIN